MATPYQCRPGLLALAGLGLLFLPFAPGAAQQPSKPNSRGLIEKAVIDQHKQELEARQAELETQLRLLKEKLRGVGALANDRAAAAAVAGGSPPVAGLPGMRFGPAGVDPAGSQPTDVSRRLEQIEHKLDALLWEITAIRRDLTKTRPVPVPQVSDGAHPVVPQSGPAPLPGNAPTTVTPAPRTAPPVKSGDAPAAGSSPRPVQAKDRISPESGIPGVPDGLPAPKGTRLPVQ